MIGQKVDPAAVSITVDGLPLPTNPDLVHYLVYKPSGVVSTADDPQGRSKVTDLVPPEPRVYPVGRLDADSEGLILLTNDGDLTNLVTHPRFGIRKTYVARVVGTPGARFINRLTAGVALDDGRASAVSARLLGDSGGEALVEIVMAEGRKREVRRMCEALGHRVTQLVRTGIGAIRDQKLGPGQWRSLTVPEIRGLYEAAGGAWQDAVGPNDEGD